MTAKGTDIVRLRNGVVRVPPKAGPNKQRCDAINTKEDTRELKVTKASFGQCEKKGMDIGGSRLDDTAQEPSRVNTVRLVGHVGESAVEMKGAFRVV